MCSSASAVARCARFLTLKPHLVLTILFIHSQPKAGVDQGPIHLVHAGLPQQLRELGWKVEFNGHHEFEDIDAQIANDPPIGMLKNPRRVSKVCEAVAQVVGAHAKRGVLPLTLGGDHSLVRLLYILAMLRIHDSVGNGNHLRNVEVSGS